MRRCSGLARRPLPRLGCREHIPCTPSLPGQPAASLGQPHGFHTVPEDPGSFRGCSSLAKPTRALCALVLASPTRSPQARPCHLAPRGSPGTGCWAWCPAAPCAGDAGWQPRVQAGLSVSVAAAICSSISARSWQSGPAMCPFDKRQVPPNNEQ